MQVVLQLMQKWEAYSELQSCLLCQIYSQVIAYLQRSFDQNAILTLINHIKHIIYQDLQIKQSNYNISSSNYCRKDIYLQSCLQLPAAAGLNLPANCFDNPAESAGKRTIPAEKGALL
ncbi:Hypothetical_protein [Hexamita inflata]|uniref:Hypothetical_protein n=1 Tax=Hexamita inflata TaxID=28002 RepID=A0AA86P0U8_9EUKA|nr:Hypothetical protein HINF_LOCUS18117 [Hexamita inflata]